MSKNWLICSSLVAISLLSAGPADATVMLYLETRQLAARASLVVEARVVHQRVSLVDGRPWTYTKLRVLRSFKGKAKRRSTIEISQLGGEVGRVGLRVAGSARFRVGERVLAFLRKAGASALFPVGMCQGKYELYRDPAGAWRARRDLSGAAFARFSPRGRFAVHAPARVVGGKDVTRSGLFTEVRAAVRAGGAR